MVARLFSLLQLHPQMSLLRLREYQISLNDLTLYRYYKSSTCFSTKLGCNNTSRRILTFFTRTMIWMRRKSLGFIVNLLSHSRHYKSTFKGNFKLVNNNIMLAHLSFVFKTDFYFYFCARLIK